MRVDDPTQDDIALPPGTTLYKATLEPDEVVLEVKTFEHTREYGKTVTGDQKVKGWLEDSRGFWKILWTGVVTVLRDGVVVNDVMTVIVRTTK